MTFIQRKRNKEITRPYQYIPNRFDLQALEDCWKGVRWIRDVLSTSRLKTQAGISVQEQQIISYITRFSSVLNSCKSGDTKLLYRKLKNLFYTVYKGYFNKFFRYNFILQFMHDI